MKVDIMTIFRDQETLERLGVLVKCLRGVVVNSVAVSVAKNVVSFTGNGLL